MTANYTKILGTALARLDDIRDRESKGLITQNGFRHEHEEAVAPLLKQLDEHYASAREDTEYARGRLQKAVDKFRNTPAGGDPTAHELKVARIWNRWQRELDAVQGIASGALVVEKAQELAKEALSDPAAATVAVQELPSYLGTRDTDADSVSEAMSDIYRSLSPEIAQAESRVTAAERYERTVRSNTRSIADEVNNRHANVDHAEMTLALRVQPEQRAITEGMRTVDIVHDITRGE